MALEELKRTFAFISAGLVLNLFVFFLIILWYACHDRLSALMVTYGSLKLFNVVLLLLSFSVIQLVMVNVEGFFRKNWCAIMTKFDLIKAFILVQAQRVASKVALRFFIVDLVLVQG